MGPESGEVEKGIGNKREGKRIPGNGKSQKSYQKSPLDMSWLCWSGPLVLQKGNKSPPVPF